MAIELELDIVFVNGLPKQKLQQEEVEHQEWMQRHEFLQAQITALYAQIAEHEEELSNIRKDCTHHFKDALHEYRRSGVRGTYCTLCGLTVW